jgi:outer membrane immunogenic protein
VLVYVKIGGGWVRNEASIANLTTGASVTASGTNGGWLVGGGVEYALTPNWTGKVEFDILTLADQTGPVIIGRPDTFNLDHDVRTTRFGINYKFN